MPQFAGLSRCDTWAALGGEPQREVARHALATCRGQFTVEAPDQNRLAFDVRRNWSGIGELTPRSVMRLTKSDGSFDEWRLNTQDAAVLGTGVKHFEALPPIYMLAECGEYYTTGAGGVRDYSYSMIEATPAQALTALVLGTPGIPGFVTIAVDSGINAVLIDVESTDEGKTPLAIAFQIRDAVRGKGVACEVDYVRIASTGYELRLVPQIGAGATVPEFSVGRNVIDYLLKYNCTQQTTRVRTKGPVDATGLAARLSRARYKATAVNGGTKRVTLADEAGGAGPIQFDEQYVGWAAFREKTGRTFAILHSYAATQEIELADVSTMAAHSVTAPEWISLRESATATGTRRYGSWAEVTAVGAGSLTLTDNWTVGDPVTVDGRWLDWQLRRASLVLATSFTMNVVAGRLDCASVAGVLPGDIVVIGRNAAAPYDSGGLGSQPGTTQAVVDTVDAINTRLSCTIRYAGTWQLGPTTFYARIFRTVATRHRVTGSTAATNVVTVDAVGTAANTDLIEIVQEDAGVLPTWIESPGDRATYGVKHSVLSLGDTGECNQIPNPVHRVWTGAANVPADGWTWSGTGAATIARDSFSLQGGYSAYCVFASGATMGVLTTPPGFVNPVIGADLESVRVRLFITNFDAGAEWDPTYTYVYAVRSTLTVTCYKRSASGALTQLGTPAVLKCPGFDDKDAVALNSWVEAVIPQIDVSGLIDETLVVQIAAAWGGSVPGGSIKAYVDGAQLTQTPAAPREYPDLLIEYAEANKHIQSANLELLTWAGPPKECTVKVADLERVDPTRYALEQITLGGMVRLRHDEQTVDLTVRAPSLGVDYLAEANTDVTLAVLPPRFTAMASGGGGGGGGGSASAGAARAATGSAVTRWNQILDVPATFPPAAHTHHPDHLVGTKAADYEAAGDVAGYAFPIARLGANSTAVVCPDGGAVTPFYSITTQGVMKLLVVGDYNDTDVFMDEIIVCGYGGSGIMTKETNDVFGAPGARTYSLNVGDVCVAIAGGGPPNNFNVRFVATEFDA